MRGAITYLYQNSTNYFAVRFQTSYFPHNVLILSFGWKIRNTTIIYELVILLHFFLNIVSLLEYRYYLTSVFIIAAVSKVENSSAKGAFIESMKLLLDGFMHYLTRMWYFHEVLSRQQLPCLIYLTIYHR